jgi:cytidylate kinase
MVIAIDGPAGTGKSTTARLLAQNLGCLYINSGNLYRAIALACDRAGIGPAETEAALKLLKALSIDYRGEDLFLGEERVTEILHTAPIDRLSAAFSAIVPLRHRVNEIIRSIARGRDLVVEGRDMTTVVFPQAEYRFYLDASARKRAERRYAQGLSPLSLEEIERAMEERDEIDKNKMEGSLKIAPGVDYFDTSDLTIMQVYAKLIERIQTRVSMGQMEVEMDESKGSSENIQTQLQEE